MLCIANNFVITMAEPNKLLKVIGKRKPFNCLKNSMSSSNVLKQSIQHMREMYR